MVCKALASLDYMMLIQATSFHYFNPQGSREPRRICCVLHGAPGRFQSTRLSRASTSYGSSALNYIKISIHKALASLDTRTAMRKLRPLDFNPQGSREPRPGADAHTQGRQEISIHKALASLDDCGNNPGPDRHEFQSTRLSRASTGNQCAWCGR